VATRQRGAASASSPTRTAKERRELKRQIEQLSDTLADLSESLRSLREATGAESLEARSRLHELDRRLIALERAHAKQDSKPEPEKPARTTTRARRPSTQRAAGA
jgi:predicted RNase H-like nuclease (RuvC/YqgF family)